MDTKHCPVCAMDTKKSSACAEHSGITYYFCTPQCRENFLARPLLYIGKTSVKRMGQEVIKRRTFSLDQAMGGMQAEALLMALKQLMSVDNINIEGDRISIDYDLLEINASQIEAALVAAGASMGSGWAERLKRGWIHYTEENQLDNLAAAESACCNKAPGKG